MDSGMVNGAMGLKLGSIRPCQLVDQLSLEDLAHSLGLLAKEATEISSDGEGRWFAFNVNLKSLVLMEKKGMPNHLQSLPCVDNPTELGTVIRELEDAGEVGAHII